MADNKALPPLGPGSEVTVATEEIGGVDFQKIKLADGRDGATRLLRLDEATNTLQTMSYEHHEIHSGDHYFIGGYTELQDTDTATFFVITPNSTKWAHMLFSLEADALITYGMYETATYAGGGSTLSLINNDRNSDNTSGLTILSAGTASVAGTLIDSFQTGAATVASKPLTGGRGTRNNEMILKQNTTYRAVITSGADDNTLSYYASWYEHTNVE